jgi:hypothetical protein
MLLMKEHFSWLIKRPELAASLLVRLRSQRENPTTRHPTVLTKPPRHHHCYSPLDSDDISFDSIPVEATYAEFENGNPVDDSVNIMDYCSRNSYRFQIDPTATHTSFSLFLIQSQKGMNGVTSDS